jgi:hypothetical protein
MAGKCKSKTEKFHKKVVSNFMFHLSLTCSWLRLSASIFCLLAYSMPSRLTLSFLTSVPNSLKVRPNNSEAAEKKLGPNFSRIILEESKKRKNFASFVI